MRRRADPKKAASSQRYFKEPVELHGVETAAARLMVKELVDWTGSPNMWLRRGATVAFVPLARRGQHPETTNEICSRLFGDHEDLTHKAVGWLLREAGETDMPRLERFLRAQGARMPRTSVRYAIERFPTAKRKRLLGAARGA